MRQLTRSDIARFAAGERDAEIARLRNDVRELRIAAAIVKASDGSQSPASPIQCDDEAAATVRDA